LKDVQPLTGYIRGGVTIFGAKKTYAVFVDETAILLDKISVSARPRTPARRPRRSGAATARRARFAARRWQPPAGCARHAGRG
ncbi:MAG: hypothetical protein ACLP62_04865, partial [Acidimicrobiales bacterium]